MFSYRHAFHAGNHADVFKHMVLLAILRHLVQKDSALMVFDTHAGAGLYRLDGDYARTSGEAADGVLRLLKPQAQVPAAAPALRDYLEVVAGFDPQQRIYPGSPFIVAQLLRERDKLKLFEWHPVDAKTLAAHVAQLDAKRHIAVLHEDGFVGLRKFLPPPTRRALVLCDPSYEIKTDYARVVDTLADALARFATGTYVVWYPIIARAEAHAMPHKLKTLATKAGREWLHASLTVKSSKLTLSASGDTVRPGLPASGMVVFNPPHTLKSALALALPELARQLAQDRHASFTLEASG